MRRLLPAAIHRLRRRYWHKPIRAADFWVYFAGLIRMRSIKYLTFVIAMFVFMPTAFSQETVQRTDPPKPASDQVQRGDDASQPPPPPGRRRMRTIVNREFDDREKIVLLLNAHCDFPSKEDLLSTSPDAETLLHDILMDDQILFSVRMRAVEALAYFDTPKNIQTLEWILAHPEEVKHPLMLMQAIRAYPKVAPQQAPAALAPYLESENDMIRFVTISSLKNCPDGAAVRVLSERYGVEKNRFFQTRLKDAIDNHCQQTSSCGN